ncbi:MAG: MOSC domain-containing protein [Flavipsychrobacter sp.]
MSRLLSVNVSLPKVVTHNGNSFTTAIFKTPVTGSAAVSQLNIAGDKQADLTVHGGIDKAVYAYSYHNYAYWEKELNRNDFTMGQFGENLTVDNMPDHEVYIGNRYRIGTTLLEVSQPRVPCFKLNARMDDNRMTKLFFNSGRQGFYLRVLEEGIITAGDEIIMEKEHPAKISVQDIFTLYYIDKTNYNSIKKAADLEELTLSWREGFKELLSKANR